jgi:hypothetical protein
MELVMSEPVVRTGVARLRDERGNLTAEIRYDPSLPLGKVLTKLTSEKEKNKCATG